MVYEDLTSKVRIGVKDLLVATTTLSTVIDHVLSGATPDLLTVDVEGYELEVLGGLDMERHRPKWILVETDRPDIVDGVLTFHRRTAQLSFHDFLYEYVPTRAGGSKEMPTTENRNSDPRLEAT